MDIERVLDRLLRCRIRQVFVVVDWNENACYEQDQDPIICEILSMHTLSD